MNNAVRTKADSIVEARDQLLKDEQELIAKVKAVAAKRRTLPPGGALKEVRL